MKHIYFIMVESFPVYLIMLILSLMLFLSACRGAEIEFAIKHLSEQAGEQATEVFSYESYPGLDNSMGTKPLSLEISLSRSYRHQIIQHITTEELSGQSIQNRIVERYQLPPNDPTGQERNAKCVLAGVIPAGKKAKIAVEWTERWAHGVIKEGIHGDKKQLGDYEVLLGYYEPCSVIWAEYFYPFVQLPISHITPIPEESYTTTIPSIISPADVIEAEYPKTLYVDQSNAIRITLKRTDLISYTPIIEVSGNDIVTAVISPPATPQVSLAETYGGNHLLIATAKLVSSNIDIQSVSPENQPYDTDTITWKFSVSGKKPGKQMVTASIYVRWLSKQASATDLNVAEVNNNIARQVWIGQFEIDVKEPIIKIGAYTVGELWTLTRGSGIVGAVFGWIAGKYIPDRKRHRKK